MSDPDRVFELVTALSEPLPTAVADKIDVVVSSGGDDTIDLFEARQPQVVVVTASLDAGDTTALVEALRAMMPRAEVAIVVVGDVDGPIRTALDAIELAPDRFVSRPLSPRALRFAVASGLEAVMLVRGPGAPSARGTSPGTDPGAARPQLLRIGPAVAAELPAAAPQPIDDGPTESTRAALRARWAALADSMVDASDDIEEATDQEPEPAALMPPPIIIRPRRKTEPEMDVVEAAPPAWRPGTTHDLPEDHRWSDVTPAPPPDAPAREPTLIIRDPIDLEGAPEEPPARTARIDAPLPAGQPPALGSLALPRTTTDDVEPPPLPRTRTPLPPISRTRTGDDRVDMAERTKPGERWSDPIPLAELLDRDSKDPLERAPAAHGEVPLDEIDDDLALGHDTDPRRGGEPRLEVLDDLPDDAPAAPSASDGRDFARQLRAKMSQMAQRLFQGGDAPAPAPADLAPRHDHHTEIDLASLGEEPALGGGTEIEARAARLTAMPDLATAPGTWDTQIRVPDAGELVRGVCDAAMLLAKMFAGGATGRIVFRNEVDKVVFFDQGRPVFASSSEPRDRMGELLVREGKITAAQYERCQAVVAESGRRMGEILVDFGYLKRRELLPAVRRHVEDIVYSLFGWERGSYQIALDDHPSAERIRLSRHPASLVLEGIRRKLDRTTLERLLGPPSTVIEIADRERLASIINLGDLAAEERAALAAFDGQADLAQVARTASVDVTDVLPLAWGLCVLGLATARRTDTEILDESTALVGETDLAIDRERVRARWQLVIEADYFALLGVRRDATTFEIRRAYQSARRDFAADCFPNDLRRELAQELDDIAHVLDEAFRVLRDDRLRMTYLTNLVE